jgi:hypothetical protein
VHVLVQIVQNSEGLCQVKTVFRAGERVHKWQRSSSSVVQRIRQTAYAWRQIQLCAWQYKKGVWDRKVIVKEGRLRIFRALVLTGRNHRESGQCGGGNRDLW